MRVLTCKQMKKSEQLAVKKGTTYLALMQNAGSEMAKIIIERECGYKNCVVLCGKGNNAGDGFVVADILQKHNFNVTVVLLFGTPTTDISKQMYDRVVENKNITVLDVKEDTSLVYSKISSTDIVVDAIFGTGFRGKVDDFTSKIIEEVNKSSSKVYAVDVPSGFNADDGNCDGVGIKADITVTFASAKVGHFTLPCKDSIGELVVCDIGISEDCLDNEGGEIYTVDYDMAYAPLKPREFNSNKGTYGKLLNISGSEEYKGAAYFSSAAAYKSGVGLVTLATTHNVTQVVATLSPETVYLPLDDEYNPTLLLNKLKTSSACLIGCGLGTSSNAQKMLFDVVKNAQCPLVIDADGINILSKNIDVLKEKKAEIILTPHPGEMARLLGKSVEEICGNRFCEASFLAKQYGVIVVLKGQNTITALPDGKIYLNTTGNAGLAKAGSGDVLAGIISSFLAQGISPQNSAISGVYIHSLCADEVAKEISQYGMTASDLLMHLPKMFLCKNNF